MRRIANIFNLGVKELRSLYRDPVLMIFIVFAFSFMIYAAAKGMSQELNNASIAVVDEDRSALSSQIINAFYGPYFKTPELIQFREIDKQMDAGNYTFILDIPSNFQRDVLAGKHPAIQVNVDATMMSQAFTGAGYIQNIINGEINEFSQGIRGSATESIRLTSRYKFNPTLNSTWFGGVMQISNMVTMLSIVLSGAALIRERERGTLEHLLVMPLTSIEIMLSKVWAMGLVVLLAAGLSLRFVAQGVLEMPIAGSVPLYMLGMALLLFSTTSLGIFLGTVARTMPQLGLLIILVFMPLQLLSGGSTPYESMPQVIQNLMLAAPTTHFVSIAQAILYRGAGFDVVWPSFLVLIGIGMVFFIATLVLFRKSLAAAQ
ncbi:MAG: ABC transporter permease [Gammaproteobacteria bacterium]|nr:ABC transporter permease [Gammaproteobacteria bacterium]MCP5407895.1 ABC transporter permease [Chromatiaceae bacterium]